MLTKRSLVAYLRAMATNQLAYFGSIFVNEILYGPMSEVQQLLVSQNACCRLRLFRTQEVLTIPENVGDKEYVHVRMDLHDVYMG
jgi:hypothetical protein